MHTPSSKFRRGRPAMAAAAGALLFVGNPAIAAAESPFAVLESAGAPVSDDELADIRGKFIKAEDISYFGISMVTSWQDNSGITTTARLVFNVDFLHGGGGKPVPSLMIGWVREGDPAMDVKDSHTGYTPVIAAHEVLPVGSLGETQGAAQANIIAGADNSALNGMQIALIPTSELAAFNSAGLSSITETTTQDFADGDQLQFRLGANEIGLVLTGNHGGDNTIQSVGGDFGSLLQQTMLSSDGNSVLNNTAVIIGHDFADSGFDAVRATEALSAMKGHGF